MPDAPQHPRVDAGPVRAHLVALAEHGVPDDRVSQRVRIRERTVARLRSGAMRRLNAATAQAILALPLDLPAKRPLADSGPVREHLGGLLAAEATVAAIAQAAQVSRAKIDHVLRRGGQTINADDADALLAVTIEGCRRFEATVPAGPVRDHVAMLMRVDDLTAHMFHLHADVDLKTFTRLMDPATGRVHGPVAERLLAINPGTIRSTKLNRVDSAPAREHIDRLVARRVTYVQIAERSGLHEHTIARIHHGDSPLVDADTVEWILGVPADLPADAAPVPSGPVTGHVRALRQAGMPRRQIALLADVSAPTIKAIESGAHATVKAAIADRILAVAAEDQSAVTPWGDLDAVREHLSMLAEAQIATRVIARHAGTTIANIFRIKAGKTDRITADLADRLLAVNALTVSLRGTEKVAAVGTQRRVEALHVLGYPNTWIAAQLGVSGFNVAGKKQVTKETADKVAGLYERWRHTPGPSQRTATWAANRGMVGSEFWDADTIDDPSATPVKRTVRDASGRLVRRTIRVATAAEEAVADAGMSESAA